MSDKGPQIKKRLTWIKLPDEYEGFEAQIWVNAPTKYWNMLGTGDEDAIIDGVRHIVLEHNGWLDFDGEPYPPASEAAFWEEIPSELAACILMAAQAEVQRLPNSLAPNNRRLKRG